LRRLSTRRISTWIVTAPQIDFTPCEVFALPTRRRNASALPGPQPLSVPPSKTPKRFPTHLWLYSLLLAAFFVVFATSLRADTISGTVKDPSGAVVAGARIEITGNNLPQPIVVESDAIGRFSVLNLTAGKYSVHVTKSGFGELVAPVDLHGTADITLKLTIAAQQTEINVTDKSLAFANTDVVYHSLRDIGTGDSFHCENFNITLDVGTFELRSGTITLLTPINKAETGLIFVGAGHFSLKPVVGIDTRELTRRSGAATAEEDFTELVLRFSPEQYQQFVAAQGAKTAVSPESTAALQRWKDKVRHRHEFPEGFTQSILENETIDNVDADVLAAVYNPQHPPFLTAYMHGTRICAFSSARASEPSRNSIPPKKSPLSIATAQHSTTASGIPSTCSPNSRTTPPVPTRKSASSSRSATTSKPPSPRTITCSAAPPLPSNR
jgi:hypothetical protein